MSATGPAPAVQNWPRLVGESLRQHGPWHTYSKLLEARRVYPADDCLRGYVEIVRNVIVRDFLARPRGMQMVPRLSAEFVADFDRFTLSTKEGYLASLIDGRLDVQKLTLLSPLDSFTTIFTLAKLEQEKVITIPS